MGVWGYNTSTGSARVLHPRKGHSLIKQTEPQNDRHPPVVLSCKVTCSFCSFWRRKRSWRLSPACPLSPWSFRSLRKPVCRLLRIWCFPCSLLWGIAPCSDFCLSRVVCRSARGFILRSAGELFSHATFRRQVFISVRSVRRAQAHSEQAFRLAGELEFPPPSLRAFLPRVRLEYRPPKMRDLPSAF